MDTFFSLTDEGFLINNNRPNNFIFLVIKYKGGKRVIHPVGTGGNIILELEIENIEDLFNFYNLKILEQQHNLYEEKYKAIHVDYFQNCYSFVRKMVNDLFESEKQSKNKKLTAAEFAALVKKVNRDIFEMLVIQYAVAINEKQYVRIFLNSITDNNLPITSLEYAEKNLSIVSREDIIKQYDRIDFSKDRNMVRNFSNIIKYFKTIKGGMFILYYLNEFRKGKKIPVIIFKGVAGSGKNIVVYLFASYKNGTSSTFFSDDKFETGNLTRSSLITLHETNEMSSSKFSIEKLKDQSESVEHDVRQMHSLTQRTTGFKTFLFTCNNRKENSLLLRELYNNTKNDLLPLRRRISVFDFGQDSVDYIKDGIGDFLGKEITKPTFRDGKVYTIIDALLNYLEDNGHFNMERLKHTCGENNIKTEEMYYIFRTPEDEFKEKYPDFILSMFELVYSAKDQKVEIHSDIFTEFLIEKRLKLKSVPVLNDSFQKYDLNFIKAINGSTRRESYIKIIDMVEANKFFTEQFPGTNNIKEQQNLIKNLFEGIN